MGQHKGWRVYEQDGMHVGAVRENGKYRTRSFEKPSLATAWAKAEAAKLTAGVAVARRYPTSTSSLALDYLKELKSLGRAATHVTETERLLKDFQKHVPDLGASNAGELVDLWLGQLHIGDDRDSPVAPATRNRHLVQVRALCAWAIRWKRLSEDPTAPIRMATVPDYLPAVFTVDELRTCIAKTTWKVVRKGRPQADPYHLLFAVLAYTGMRFGEGSGFDPANIDWSGRMIAIRLHAGLRIKRQRERWVPMQDELAELLEPFKGKSGPIFAGRAHNSYRGFRAFVERCGLVLGERSPHSLRHSYAGMMTATGISGLLLADYLGHTSVATTKEYTKLAHSYVRSVEGWPRGVLRLRAQGAATGAVGRDQLSTPAAAAPSKVRSGVDGQQGEDGKDQQPHR